MHSDLGFRGGERQIVNVDAVVSANKENFLCSSPLMFFDRKIGNGFVVMATKSSNSRPLTGVLFVPFEEVKKESRLVSSSPQPSPARQLYVDECEAAITEQINVEYDVSYVYHALYACFDRDNVALKGFAKFFKESSDEERGHAEKLMEYQNKRVDNVRLQSIVTPLSEFDHVEKGDALYDAFHTNSETVRGPCPFKGL